MPATVPAAQPATIAVDVLSCCWTSRTAELFKQIAEDHYAAGVGGYPASAEQTGDAMRNLTAELPPKISCIVDQPWLARFLLCFRTLTQAINTGQAPTPGCVGEQVALQLLIDQAETNSLAAAENPWLPLHEGGDDFEQLRHLLLPEQTALDLLRAGTEMTAGQWEFCSPANWFTPFRSLGAYVLSTFALSKAS